MVRILKDRGWHDFEFFELKKAHELRSILNELTPWDYKAGSLENILADLVALNGNKIQARIQFLAKVLNDLGREANRVNSKAEIYHQRFSEGALKQLTDETEEVIKQALKKVD